MVLVYGQEKYLVLKDMDIADISQSVLPNDVNCDVACLVYDCTNANTFSYIASLYKVGFFMYTFQHLNY